MKTARVFLFLSFLLFLYSKAETQQERHLGTFDWFAEGISSTTNNQILKFTAEKLNSVELKLTYVNGGIIEAHGLPDSPTLFGLSVKNDRTIVLYVNLDPHITQYELHFSIKGPLVSLLNIAVNEKAPSPDGEGEVSTSYFLTFTDAHFPDGQTHNNEPTETPQEETPQEETPQEETTTTSPPFIPYNPNASPSSKEEKKKYGFSRAAQSYKVSNRVVNYNLTLIPSIDLTDWTTTFSFGASIVAFNSVEGAVAIGEAGGVKLSGYVGLVYTVGEPIEISMTFITDNPPGIKLPSGLSVDYKADDQVYHQKINFHNNKKKRAMKK